MTIAVTGARGKVGRELVPLLAHAGEPVRALGRTSTPRFDWTDATTWRAALVGASQLFLLVPGGDDGHRDVAAEAAKAPVVLETAMDAGVERVVLLTALGMDHAPDDAPLRALELHVQARAPAWTIVRPNWFFQNLTDGPLAELIEAGAGELRVPLADARVSYVDARDVAAVCAAALCQPGHDRMAYDLTGPASLTMAEVAAVMSGQADASSDGWPAPMRYRHLAAAAFRDEAASLGWDPAYIETMCELFEVMRAGWAADVTDDVAQVLGRAPRSLASFAG